MHKYISMNTGGHTIRCKIYSDPEETPRKAVLYSTGFAGHKDNGAAQAFASEALSRHKDWMVIVFNWPAHGDDDKSRLTLADCDSYITSVLARLKNEYGIRKVYSYATSFGGYLILKYISEHANPFQKIVLRCPAVDMYDVLVHGIMRENEYDAIMKGKDAEVGFDRKIIVTHELLDALQANDIRLRDYRGYADVLRILHGTKDEIVPFESCREFASQNGIPFQAAEGADHRFKTQDHMSLANRFTLSFFES